MIGKILRDALVGALRIRRNVDERRDQPQEGAVLRTIRPFPEEAPQIDV